MAEFKMDVKRQVAVLSENDKGYSMQVNIISYNGREPKLDIRTWKDDKMLKGVTLNAEEIEALKAALDDIQEGEVA